MRIDRLIGILSILLQKETVTAPYLAEQFEVSRRTINRDIEELCKAGIPVVTKQGTNGGISIMENYKIDRTLFTNAEMQDILAGLRSLDSIHGTNRYGQLMEKLSVGSSDFMAGNQSVLIDLSSWYKDSLAPKIESVRNGIDHAKELEFTYFSKKGETVRIIEPYYLIFRWSSWYVWGWCKSRKDYRLFKLNRMEHLHLLGNSFTKRNVPMPNLSNERIFPGGIRVKVLFHAQCKWRLIEEFGINSFEKQPDGRLLFQADYTDKENLLAWLMTFREQAVLLEPKELCREISEILDNMKKNYANEKNKGGHKMANKELAEYIMDQLSDLKGVRNIPMMGGYVFYYQERIFGGIYESGFMVKITEASKRYMPESIPQAPYEGAKEMLPVTILDDRKLLQNMVSEMYVELPERKPKKTLSDLPVCCTEKKKVSNKAFDYKKEYKEFYLPKKKPEIVTIPSMNYIAVRGKGDPNEPDGEYKKAIGVLYAIAYAIKMSKMGKHRMEGYFDFVVPPLEGFWWQDGIEGFDYNDKSAFCWISVIRLPEFVTEEEFIWAKQEAAVKKKLDVSAAEFYTVEEGLCVQMMHIGPFDKEPDSVAYMDRFLEENGYRNDFSPGRLHHEIYLSDARKTAPEKLKTVIRHPIKKI